MVSALSRPYPFKLFKGFLSHILLGPFFNTLSHILIMFSNICNMLTMFSNMFSNICKHANTAIAITLVLETVTFKWHEPVSPQVLLAKWTCDKIDLFSASKLNCTDCHFFSLATCFPFLRSQKLTCSTWKSVQCFPSCRVIKPKLSVLFERNESKKSLKKLFL